MSNSLNGQIVLITGGGRGLGRLYAKRLAAAGAIVAVASRSEAQLHVTVREIKAAGGEALSVPFDVTDLVSVKQGVADVLERYGRIDLLINNAGVLGPMGLMWEVEPEHWWHTMEVHLQGTYFCTSAVLPSMIEKRQGRIINMVSHAGAHRWPTLSAYAVAKAAVIKLTENLAFETKRHNIPVFAVHPGLVIGLGMEHNVRSIKPTKRTQEQERILAWIDKEMAAGHTHSPDRGAQLILSLASGQADQLSGRYLTVDEDMTTMMSHAKEIQQKNLYLLQIKKFAHPQFN